MTSPPTVLAVSGSLRGASYTHSALEHVLAAAKLTGAETEMLDLREADVPMFDPDADDQGVDRYTRQVRDADAVVLGTPVYHGSYSGVLKNFHDYCGFDDYEETPVALVAVAGGGSYGSTLEHLRSTVRGVHGHVVPEQVGVRNASNKFESDPHAPGGRMCTDQDITDRLDSLGEAIVEAARRFDVADAGDAAASSTDD